MTDYIMRDIDNRGDDGPFEIRTQEAEVIIAYLDGALRKDLTDPTTAGPDIDQAIAHLRAGEIEQANALLRSMCIHLSTTDPQHQEHITVSWAYELACLEGDCEHVDVDGEPEDLSACPTVPPFDVCTDCMDDAGHGRDPENWDDVPLLAWPCNHTTALAAEPLVKP